jgi:hypothetical protein
MKPEGDSWVVVATYGYVLEADMAAATLQEAGIPARVSGAHVGLFGAGFQGFTQYGAQVIVPWHRADEAAELLEGLFGEAEEDGQGHEEEDGAA